MGINRDIGLCVARLQAAWAYLRIQYGLHYPGGPTIILVETFRTADVQRAYYAQGRQKLAIVNSLRKKAGLPAIGPAEARRRITFKLPGGSRHEQVPARAFDIGFVQDGAMVWDAVHYERAARILAHEFADVVWGGDWDGDGHTDDEKFVDMPHFQV